MPSDKSFSKRLGFKRTNTTGDPVTVTELSAFQNELAPQPEAGPVGRSSSVVDGNAMIAEEVGQMSAGDAKNRLKNFRRQNQWDPNMPDSAFDAIDEATEGNDQKGGGGAKLVGEVIENSPYPEVSSVIICVQVRPLTEMYRFALLFATTMRTFLPALSEPGSSVFS